MNRKFRDDLLKKILSQPSAPFRERHVIEVVQETLMEARVPHFSDPIGNIVIGAESKREYLQLLSKKTSEPLRVFIAHMDHPGFHGESWKGPGKLEIRWHGGSPTQHLEGAQVWLASQKMGFMGNFRMSDVKLSHSGRSIETAIVQASTEIFGKAPAAATLYGGFSFRDWVWEKNEIIYTKAADDLVGSFAIVSVALDLWERVKRKASGQVPFIGILTRAEEVGFIGAIGHFQLGWLGRAKRPLVCVSLETSRTLPGAEIGKGPVVRLGDRSGVFDAPSLEIFTQLALKALPGRHQRRIMDGGTCEATAALAFGYPSIGISVPLGNYHNQSFEGGPDSRGPMGPAPEFVHRRDIAGLIELCHSLLEPKLPWKNPWEAKRRKFKGEFRRYQTLLRSGLE